MDVAVERFQLDPGAARAEREGEAPLGGVGDAHRKVRFEIAVECGDRDGRVGPLRDADLYVAGVGRETVVTAVFDGAVVAHAPVHGGEIDVGRFDVAELDVAVHGFGGDVADDVGHGDVVVDRVE